MKNIRNCVAKDIKNVLKKDINNIIDNNVGDHVWNNLYDECRSKIRRNIFDRIYKEIDPSPLIKI